MAAALSGSQAPLAIDAPHTRIEHARARQQAEHAQLVSLKRHRQMRITLRQSMRSTLPHSIFSIGLHCSCSECRRLRITMQPATPSQASCNNTSMANVRRATNGSAESHAAPRQMQHRVLPMAKVNRKRQREACGQARMHLHRPGSFRGQLADDSNPRSAGDACASLPVQSRAARTRVSGHGLEPLRLGLPPPAKNHLPPRSRCRPCSHGSQPLSAAWNA